MKRSIFNWSSGKDSALALYYAMQNPDIDIKYLFSVINSDTNRIGMHEIPVALLALTFLPFCFRFNIIGIDPIISMTAKSTINALKNS